MQNNETTTVISKMTVGLILLVLLGFNPILLFSESASLGVLVSYAAKPMESQILRDLDGQVITDPSPDSYFPSSWSWTIKLKDISYLTFIHETSQSSYYVAIATIHMKRHQMPVDVKVILTYMNNNNGWALSNMQVQSITFPSQRDYSSCVKMYMDYDFMPALVVKNTCNCKLFIAGAYVYDGETTRFAVELEPDEETTLAYGPAPQRYSIHFAYRE